MTRYNTLNVQLSNSQLNKLKSEIKNGTEVSLNFSSHIASDDKANFPLSPSKFSYIKWTCILIHYITVNFAGLLCFYKYFFYINLLHF